MAKGVIAVRWSGQDRSVFSEVGSSFRSEPSAWLAQ